MNPQKFESLRERLASLERRLLIAVVVLFFVAVSMVVSVRLQNAYARSNFVCAAGDEVTRADLDAIQRQINEFRGELAALGIRITAIEERRYAQPRPQPGFITLEFWQFAALVLPLWLVAAALFRHFSSNRNRTIRF